MKKETKKLIAREGLVFIGIMVLSFICAYSPDAYIGNIGHGMFYFGYPLYLLIRFIIWAVKTLMR